MPTREHTDPSALDAMWNRQDAAAPMPASWWRRLWFWVEDCWREPVEAVPVPDLIARRIRVYRIGGRYARRLSRIDAGEAREILGVTAMLLGVEVAKAARTRRAQAKAPAGGRMP